MRLQEKKIWELRFPKTYIGDIFQNWKITDFLLVWCNHGLPVNLAILHGDVQVAWTAGKEMLDRPACSTYIDSCSLMTCYTYSSFSHQSWELLKIWAVSANNTWYPFLFSQSHFLHWWQQTNGYSAEVNGQCSHDGPPSSTTNISLQNLLAEIWTPWTLQAWKWQTQCLLKPLWKNRSKPFTRIT